MSPVMKVQGKPINAATGAARPQKVSITMVRIIVDETPADETPACRLPRQIPRARPPPPHPSATPRGAHVVLQLHFPDPLLGRAFPGGYPLSISTRAPRRGGRGLSA